MIGVRRAVISKVAVDSKNSAAFAQWDNRFTVGCLRVDR